MNQFEVPTTMRALRQHEPNGPLVLQTIPVPEPGPGEVLVRMAASPINPSDLALMKGDYLTRQYPFVPGLEGSGTVVKAGNGLLPGMRLGKRVACTPNPEADGAWADYMKTAALRTVPLPAKMGFEVGAMMLVNPMTAMAFMALAKEGKHRAMVNNAAASALGKMLIRLAQKQGFPLINIVHRQAQVEELEAMGDTHVLNSSNEDFESNLRELAADLGATLFLDAVTGDQTALLLRASPPGSTIIVYARLSGDPIHFEPGDIIIKSKRVIGFQVGNWLATKSLPFKLMFVGKLKRQLSSTLASNIHARLPLEKADEAIAIYKNNMTAGKVLLTCTPDGTSE